MSLSEFLGHIRGIMTNTPPGERREFRFPQEKVIGLEDSWYPEGRYINRGQSGELPIRPIISGGIKDDGNRLMEILMMAKNSSKGLTSKGLE